MIRKYALFAPLCSLLLPALTIVSGCSEPAAAPAKTAGLTPVPPQPEVTPKTGGVEVLTLVPTTPPTTEPAAQPATETQKESPTNVPAPKPQRETGSFTLDTINLLPEGGWEDGYSGWQLKGKAAIRTDGETKVDGVRSLRFDLKGSTGFELVRWEVAKGTVKAGNEYLLTGIVKTQGLDPQSEVRLTAFTIDSKTSKISWIKSAPYTGDTDWKPIDITYTVPEGADQMAVRIEYSRSSKTPAKEGTIWFDTLQLNQKFRK